jgi:hypothetical protein
LVAGDLWLVIPDGSESCSPWSLSASHQQPATSHDKQQPIVGSGCQTEILETAMSLAAD